MSPQEAALRMGMYAPGSFPMPPTSSWPPSGSPVFPDPGAAFPFQRPGFVHPREHLIQRAVQPGFAICPPGFPATQGSGPENRPGNPLATASAKPLEHKPEQTFSASPSPSTSGQSSTNVSPRGGTLITRQTPEPGEVTIEKAEQSWGGGVSPCPAPSASWAPPRGSADPVRPPARRSRMRDLLSGAVRSALSNHSLEDEAERFGEQMGSTFASTLGSPVKKEK